MEKINVWIYFDPKGILENKIKIFNLIFWFEIKQYQKINFQKIFDFLVLVIKLKTEKWKVFKVRIFFKSKNELYYRCTYFHCYMVLKVKCKIQIQNVKKHSKLEWKSTWTITIDVNVKRILKTKN